MNSLFFIILNFSILNLIGKYTSDLKSERILVAVLILFGLACLSIILANSFHTPIFINVEYVIMANPIVINIRNLPV